MNTATVADVTDVDVSEATQARPPAIQQPQQRTAIAMATPDDLLRLAVEKNASIEQLSALFDLRERFFASEARKAFVSGMAAFKREPLEIYKRKSVGYETRDGDFVGYKHAELSDITDVIAPAMARHGLSFDWDIHQAPGVITVDCIVTHELGHSKMVSMSGAPDNSGKKNMIQQVASTITYLQRYTLLAATGMSTKNQDDDGAGGADNGDDSGGNAGTQGNAPPETAPRGNGSKSAPKFYDETKFNANKDSWREVVRSKRKTPAQMISFIESKGVSLTEDQKLTIDSWSHEND
jgi:hypothetical protein